MGLFARRKCARCRTPLKIGSDVCPYCAFDPAPPLASRRLARANPDHDPEPRPDPDEEIAPEAAPWHPEPDMPTRPTARGTRKGPWQSSTDHPVLDTGPGDWDEVGADMDITARRGDAAAAGPWGEGRIEETSLERMVRDNPKLSPVKKPNRFIWLVVMFMIAMVFRFIFGA